METTRSATASALTSARGQETTGGKVNIATWAKWLKFDTFGDKQLEQMVSATANFILDVREKKQPRWLSFVGTSGAGKTFLARKIFRYIDRSGLIKSSADLARDELSYATEFCFWPKLADELQTGGGRGQIQQLAETKFVVLDDIGAKRDNTGFITGELSTLLGRRAGKWTVLTANFGLQEIAEKIDPRVASRMIRDGGVVVDVDVKDFSLR